MLFNKFSNMFRAHVVLGADRGNLVCTGKVVWPQDKGIETLALEAQRYLPGGERQHDEPPVADTYSDGNSADLPPAPASDSLGTSPTHLTLNSYQYA